MSEWKPIETSPERPMDVLLFAANAEWRDWDTDEIADVPDGCRYEIGYWDGTDFFYHGTNHLVFEDGPRDESPTHWAPLLAPPAKVSGAKRAA